MKKMNKKYTTSRPMTSVERVRAVRDAMYNEHIKRHGKFDMHEFHKEITEGKLRPKEPLPERVIRPMTTAERIDAQREERYDDFVRRHGKFDPHLYYKEINEGRCRHAVERRA